MNNPWAIALMIGAAIAFVLTCRTPRAWLWIAIAAASFTASSLFWDYGDHRWHPPFTFFCDALVCLSFHFWAQEKWELGCFACYLTSCFVSIVMLAGWIPQGILYASLLELCNWAFLLTIGSIGLMDLVKTSEHGFVGRMHGRLHSARTSV